MIFPEKIIEIFRGSYKLRHWELENRIGYLICFLKRELFSTGIVIPVELMAECLSFPVGYSCDKGYCCGLVSHTDEGSNISEKAAL